MRNLKIVLTGGPCAGKTTIMKAVKERLQEEGYHVITLPENATDLIERGILLNNDDNLNKFQDMIFKKQMLNEEQADIFLTFNYSKPCIILCDRGVIDNKAYLDKQSDFDDILNKYNYNEITLLDDYDLVLDLLSVATCKEEKYDQVSNPTRMENLSEAKRVDRKTTEAWLGHRNLKVIDSSMTIEEETEIVMEYINNLLNNNQTKEIKRYLVNNNSNFNIYNDNNSKLINVKNLYLDKYGSEYAYDNNDMIITIRSYKDKISLLYTEIKEENDLLTTYCNYQLNIKNVEDLINKYGIKSIISKNELTFYQNRQLYKLCFYDDYTILEIEENKYNNKLIIPNNLIIDTELTNQTEKNLKKTYKRVKV